MRKNIFSSWFSSRLSRPSVSQKRKKDSACYDQVHHQMIWKVDLFVTSFRIFNWEWNHCMCCFLPSYMALPSIVHHLQGLETLHLHQWFHQPHQAPNWDAPSNSYLQMPVPQLAVHPPAAHLLIKKKIDVSRYCVVEASKLSHLCQCSHMRSMLGH